MKFVLNLKKDPKLYLPFDADFYRPSSEKQRLFEQEQRNNQRVIEYLIKRNRKATGEI